MFKPIERLIAFRYFFSPKNDGFISLISTLSFVGIMLGVAALIIVTSVLNGFRTELMQQLIGIKGHLLIYPTGPVKMETLLKRLDTIPAVTRALPVSENPTIMSTNGRFTGVIVFGHDPDRLRHHSYFSSKIKQGSLQALKKDDTVLIGIRMAEEYNLQLGDQITLITPSQDESILGTITKERNFTVVGIFDLGMREYDKRFVFTSLENAQSFYETGPSHIEVFTNPPEHMDKKIAAALADFKVDVLDWEHTNAPALKALNIEKNVMFIVLTLIIMIAVLNIVSSLVMLVKDKTKDIAILRTMGMSQQSIGCIFLINGITIGVLGTLCGFVIGIAFVKNIDTIRLLIERILGTQLFSAEAYGINQLPALLNWTDVALVCGLSVSCSILASLYPSLRAARLDPVQILR